MYNMRVFGGGNDVDIIRRNEFGEPVEGGLHQGLTGVEQIQKLLGIILPADGPEAAADTPGHDDCVLVFVHKSVNYILRSPGRCCFLFVDALNNPFLDQVMDMDKTFVDIPVHYRQLADVLRP